MKEKRDEAVARAALEALREGAKGDGNLLALAIPCARARCTLGEISKAMEDVFGRHVAEVKSVKGVYGARYGGDPYFEAIQTAIQAFERRTGRPPCILIAKMGQDGHDRGAKVVGSAFTDLGFRVVVGPLFQTPEEAAALARDSHVDVVGASSLAAGHKTLVPELIRNLRSMGLTNVKVVVGGVIPAQDYEYLRSSGASAVFGPGTNILETAAEILRLLGHNMPPMTADAAQ
jgi:methylmalonyl-CoA mutase